MIFTLNYSTTANAYVYLADITFVYFYIAVNNVLLLFVCFLVII